MQTLISLFSPKLKVKPSVNLKKDKEDLFESDVNRERDKNARGVGILIKTKTFSEKENNDNSLLLLYVSISYCNHIWGTSCSKIFSVYLFYKNDIRIIFDADPRCYSEPPVQRTENSKRLANK